MDCRTVRDRIAAWEDQELSPGETSQMREHLEHCSECMAFSQRIREQSRWLADLPPPALPELNEPDFWKSMDDRLSRELDQMQQIPLAGNQEDVIVWRRRRFSVPLPAVVAYAAALILAVLWGLDRTDETVMVQANSDSTVKMKEEPSLESTEVHDAPSEVDSSPTVQDVRDVEPPLLRPQRRVTVPPELIRPASYQPHRGNF